MANVTPFVSAAYQNISSLCIALHFVDEVDGRVLSLIQTTLPIGNAVPLAMHRYRPRDQSGLDGFVLRAVPVPIRNASLSPHAIRHTRYPFANSRTRAMVRRTSSVYHRPVTHQHRSPSPLQILPDLPNVSTHFREFPLSNSARTQDISPFNSSKLFRSPSINDVIPTTTPIARDRLIYDIEQTFNDINQDLNSLEYRASRPMFPSSFDFSVRKSVISPLNRSPL
jgi:hypothetical protein